MTAATPDRDRIVVLEDGRRMCWRELGARDGRPIIALHGTPGSRLKFLAGHQAAARLGLRLISVDRWGYGGTSLHPSPTLSGYAGDISQFADRIGLGHFGVLGVSGGGPFAVAVAAVLGPRVPALALVAPVGPMAGARPLRDMALFHWLCFRVLPYVPGAVRIPFVLYRALLAVAPEMAVRVAFARAGRADRELVADADVRRSLAATFGAGLQPGVGGAVLDMDLFACRWTIEPGAVRARSRVWLGSEDRNVPLQAARWLASALPDGELHVLHGHGHYWLVRNHDQVLSWMARYV